MGKNGSWFSAIKRIFAPSSKDKPADDSEKRSRKEKKKKGIGKLKHGDSFIPHFRQPSSIEKILGEAEREQRLIDFRPIGSFDQPQTPSLVPSRVSTPLQNASISPWTTTPQRVSTSPKGSMSRRLASSPKVAISPPISFTPQRSASPPRSFAPREVVSPYHVATTSNDAASPWSSGSRFVHRPRPKPTLRYQHICATRIQAAFRGYMTRRSYRALRGLVRLRGVVKGESVKRQTVNAIKCMQLLVRVQTQIHSRRIQMLENQTDRRQAPPRNNDRDLESSTAKWSLSQMFEDRNSDRWDDSLLTKEEAEATAQRKFEAMIKRERAMAYAYSRQSWKPSKTPLMDIRASGGFPWWWNWLDRHTNPAKPSQAQQATKSLNSTPARPAMTSPLLSQQNLGSDANLIDTTTPRSATVPSRMQLSPTPPSWVPGQKHDTRPREANSPFKAHFKDDDSLMSCPAFSAPRYMEPTLSAKAKVREGSFRMSPEVEAKRRVSFPFKWSRRGSAVNTPSGETGSTHRVLEKKQSMQSVGNLSVDSTVSVPAAVGRKPFNRFV